MRISVQGNKNLSYFIYYILQRWGIPVELDNTTQLPSFAEVTKNIRTFSEKLESPIKVTRGKPLRWRDHLIMEDNDVFIKGTLVTVSQIISQIVDGYTLKDIRRDYPEVTLEDIKACICYYAEQEDCYVSFKGV